MASTSNHFHIRKFACSKFLSDILDFCNCATESPFFQNMPWLEHDVWTQRSGLIFKDHMSDDDWPLKVRPLNCLQMPCTIHPVIILKTSASFLSNGKTWWYFSLYLIHNICDSFQESLKSDLHVHSSFHFSVCSVRNVHFLRTLQDIVHYSMMTCGHVGDL